MGPLERFSARVHLQMCALRRHAVKAKKASQDPNRPFESGHKIRWAAWLTWSLLRGTLSCYHPHIQRSKCESIFLVFHMPVSLHTVSACPAGCTVNVDVVVVKQIIAASGRGVMDGSGLYVGKVRITLPSVRDMRIHGSQGAFSQHGITRRGPVHDLQARCSGAQPHRGSNRISSEWARAGDLSPFTAHSLVIRLLTCTSCSRSSIADTGDVSFFFSTLYRLVLVCMHS